MRREAGASYKAVDWLGDRLRIIDQVRLPNRLVYVELRDAEGVARAIRSLQVRGAPLIGIAAAYGVVLGARGLPDSSLPEFKRALEEVASALEKTRPTAVNLPRAVNQMRRAWACGSGRRQIEDRLLEEAVSLEREEEDAAEKMGQYGAELLADGDLVLTHCNSGSLATAGVGTALGVIKVAHRQGKHVQVLVSETRPLLQGARLTAWELKQEGIPFTLITDSMAGYFMKKGEVKAVLTGADRIAANGDSANKIGTYTLAVLAMEHGIPFYVAAPTSTVDLSLASGEGIPIEERDPREVTHMAGASIAPRGTRAANPAFDVTPHHYVSAIITEKGVLREPYEERLKKAVGGHRA